MGDMDKYLSSFGFEFSEDGYWEYKKGCMDFYLYHFENPEGPRHDTPTSKNGVCPQLDELFKRK